MDEDNRHGRPQARGAAAAGDIPAARLLLTYALGRPADEFSPQTDGSEAVEAVAVLTADGQVVIDGVAYRRWTS